MKQPFNGSETVPVIDEVGNVIAESPRHHVHGGSNLLHPVVHLHIIDHEGRIYLQKRSMKKDLLPGYWDTAVGGHVSYGEQIEEALFREAGEELGLNGFNPTFIDSYIFESALERELISVFATVGAFEVSPDNDEVDEGRWWTVQEIDSTLGHDILTPNFECEYARVKDKLLALL